MRVQEEGRPATEEERTAIAAYMGWGSFGQELFNGSWDYARVKAGWEEENRWLREYLGRERWESAQASIINAHFTDPHPYEFRNRGIDRNEFRYWNSYILSSYQGHADYDRDPDTELPDLGLNYNQALGGASTVYFEPIREGAPITGVSFQTLSRQAVAHELIHSLMVLSPAANEHIANTIMSETLPVPQQYQIIAPAHVDKIRDRD